MREGMITTGNGVDSSVDTNSSINFDAIADNPNNELAACLAGPTDSNVAGTLACASATTSAGDAAVERSRDNSTERTTTGETSEVNVPLSGKDESQARSGVLNSIPEVGTRSLIDAPPRIERQSKNVESHYSDAPMARTVYNSISADSSLDFYKQAFIGSAHGEGVQTLPNEALGPSAPLGIESLAVNGPSLRHSVGRLNSNDDSLRTELNSDIPNTNFYKGTFGVNSNSSQLRAGLQGDPSDDDAIPDPKLEPILPPQPRNAPQTSETSNTVLDVVVQAQTVYEELESATPLSIQLVQGEVAAFHSPSDESRRILYDQNGRPVSSPIITAPKESVASPTSGYLSVRRRWALGVMFGLLVATVVALSVVVALKNSRSSLPVSLLPTVDETLAPTPTIVSPYVAEQVREYLGNITLTNQTFTESVAARDNRTTPEELAVQRLLQTNYINEPPDTPALQLRWRQRYALACLLATALPESSFDNHTLDGDECEWVGVECDEMDMGASVGVQNVSVKIDLLSFELTGSIPVDLGLLSTLTHVDLSFNEMTGSLPSSIGRWTNLEYFSAAANEFTGSLPESMSQWSHLTHFDVGPNRITGTLPSWIGLWTALQFFSVAINSFTGTIPEEIGRWSNLQTFNAYANFVLEGSLPNSVGAWTNLDFLDAAWNQLTGSLPSSIGQWTNVTVVSLTRNFLTGTIPESIGDWAVIERAYFASNNFTGSVPASICIGRDAESQDIVVDEGIPCQCC